MTGWPRYGGLHSHALYREDGVTPLIDGVTDDRDAALARLQAVLDAQPGVLGVLVIQREPDHQWKVEATGQVAADALAEWIADLATSNVLEVRDADAYAWERDNPLNDFTAHQPG